MLSEGLVLLLALAPTALGWEFGKSGRWSKRDLVNCHGNSYINYTSVPGFFLQDNSSTVASTFDYTTVNYGLINQSYPTDAEYDPTGSKTQWERFAYYVDILNAEADKDTQYKVLYIARHAEGAHNAAQTYYGTPAWNCYWAEQDGNGTATWFDALLTDAGVKQTLVSNTFWAQQLAVSKQPAPQSYYTSPMARCLYTANLTFGNLDLPEEYPFVPTVKELLRETIDVHTCDSRHNLSYIENLFPSYKIEEGFSFNDTLWDPEVSETSVDQQIRSRVLLDDVFSNDEHTWISFTTHSGEATALLAVLNHITFSLGTGQAIPVLVKAQKLKTGPTTTSQAWTSSATCNAPPVTSLATGGCVCSTGTATLATSTATITPAARFVRL
ncbi:histidine phosphatase superfamily [Xylariales sp. PMI_506]|nr:histidine phosphatase superfamily [Xylariales sp. PMI_506]